MANRRPDHFERERVTISYDHASAASTSTFKFFKVPAGRKLKIERVSYINPTGLAGSATDAFVGTVQKGATVMATLFNTETDNGGATLTADTFVEGALSATAANQWGDAADVISFVATEVGSTATLPAGRVVLEGYLY